MNNKVKQELENLKNIIENDIKDLKNSGYSRKAAEGIACMNYGGNKYLRDLATAIFNDVFNN